MSILKFNDKFKKNQILKLDLSDLILSVTFTGPAVIYGTHMRTRMVGVRQLRPFLRLVVPIAGRPENTALWSLWIGVHLIKK